MKKFIFYIDSMQMGGAQRVMNNLIDFFSDKGIAIKLINDIKPSDIEPEYAIDERVERIFLDESSLNGVKKNIHRIKKLRTIIKDEEPDLILSFLGPPNIRMLLATIGLKTKKIVSVRNDPSREYGRGIKRFIAKTIFLLADGCVFQTDDAKEYFFSKTQKSSIIIFNPVNPKFYDYVWQGKGTDIVFIGRLQPQKNPLLALNAFIKISDDYPEYRMVFYGDEELSSVIMDVAHENKIEDRIKIAGKTDNVGKVLEEAALFILSSDYEGMPNVLMEAMTVGVPVISTDCPCGGPRMLIREDNQGILVPCRDVASLASAMRKILENDELKKILSTNERKRSADFQPSIILEQWNQYLN